MKLNGALVYLIFQYISVASSIEICTLNNKILKLAEVHNDLKTLFRIWHYAFKKEYDLKSDIAAHRVKVFSKNLQIIKNHNSKRLSYVYGLGYYSDFTDEEFRFDYLRYRNVHLSSLDMFEKNNLKDLDEPDDLHTPEGYEEADYEVMVEKKLDGQRSIKYELGNFYSPMSTYIATTLYDIFSGSKSNVSIEQLWNCSLKDKKYWDQLIIQLLYWRRNNPLTPRTYLNLEDSDKCNGYHDTPLPNIKDITYCSNLFSKATNAYCSIKKINDALKLGPYATRLCFNSELRHYNEGVVEQQLSDSMLDCHLFAIVIGYSKKDSAFQVKTLLPKYPLLKISSERNYSNYKEQPVIALGAGSTVIQPIF